MKNIALAALALMIAACAEAPTTSPSTAAAVTAPSQTTSQLATFTSGSNGFDTHSYWLDTGREVVVFDAQFTTDYANQLIAAIHAQTDHPIRWVVVTHPNPDKFNGAPAFQALGAKVIASESTAAAMPGVHAYKKNYFVNVAHSFTDATYPAEAHVDVTFRGDYDLPLEGGTTVHLHELAHRGVSSTQTIAYLPESKSLVVGDLVHVRAHAWLEGGIVDGKPTPDLASWSLALDELRAYPNAVVFGGRGETADVESAVATEKAYLTGMDELVTKYVADLGDNAATELTGANASTDWANITKLAQAAYPDYALSYMIDYGVYGLADQRAGL